MKAELKGLDKKQLEKLRARIDAELKRKDDARVAEALKEVRKVAKSHNVTVDQIMEEWSSKKDRVSKPRKASKPVPPKYRSPTDPEQTWTGRGRKPKWVEAHLEAGGTMEDIAIS